MKNLIKILADDIKSENPTNRELLLYGIIYPLVIVAVAAFAGALLS